MPASRLLDARRTLLLCALLLSPVLPATYAQDPAPVATEPSLYDELLPEKTSIPAPEETSVPSESMTVKIHLRVPKTSGGVSVRVENTEVTGWEALEQTLSDARVNAGPAPHAVIVVDPEVPEADVKQLSDLVAAAGFSNFYLTTAVSSETPAAPAQVEAAAGGGDLFMALRAEDRPKLETVLEFNFDGTDVASAISQIMKSARIGAFVAPEVQGPINANFVDRSVGSVLSLLFRKYALQLVDEDGFYVIRPAAAAGDAATVAEPGVPEDTAAGEEALAPPAADTVFQIRLMAPPQDREHTEIDYISMETPQGPIHLPMQRDILCTGQDVLSAEIVEVAGESMKVRIRVNDVAAARIGRATANNLGNQLGFVYQGRLIAVPTIRDMITSEAEISGNGADWPARARELVEYLQPDTAP